MINKDIPFHKVISEQPFGPPFLVGHRCRILRFEYLMDYIKMGTTKENLEDKSIIIQRPINALWQSLVLGLGFLLMKESS